MSSTLYLLSTDFGPKTAAREALPPLDLDPLTSFLDMAHGHNGYQGHGPQLVQEYTDYRDSSILPNLNSGPWYYQNGIYYQAYKLTEYLGSADARFLTYADAAELLTQLLIERRALVPYRLHPDGMAMMYAHDPVTYASLATTLRKAGGYPTESTGFVNTYGTASGYSNEAVHREVALRGAIGRNYYRMVGYDHADYPDTGSVWALGTSYHRCMRWMGPWIDSDYGGPGDSNHTKEWFDDWKDATNPSFQDSFEYARYVANPPSGWPKLRNHNAFMRVFGLMQKIYAYEQDPTYQGDASLRANILESIEFDFNEGWYPPSGINGAEDEFGAMDYKYQDCGASTGFLSAMCGGAGGSLYGDRRPNPSAALTAFWLGPLMFAFKQTGNSKYLNRTDTIWNQFAQNRSRNWYGSQAGAKAFNQQLWTMWYFLGERGNIPRWY